MNDLVVILGASFMALVWFIAAVAPVALFALLVYLLIKLVKKF